MTLKVNLCFGNVNMEGKPQANIVMDWHPYFKAFESRYTCS